jgi:hypothetical protein
MAAGLGALGDVTAGDVHNRHHVCGARDPAGRCVPRKTSGELGVLRS